LERVWKEIKGKVCDIGTLWGCDDIFIIKGCFVEDWEVETLVIVDVCEYVCMERVMCEQIGTH
jgi:hypothetical protein